MRKKDNKRQSTLVEKATIGHYSEHTPEMKTVRSRRANKTTEFKLRNYLDNKKKNS